MGKCRSIIINFFYNYSFFFCIQSGLFILSGYIFKQPPFHNFFEGFGFHLFASYYFGLNRVL